MSQASAYYLEYAHDVIYGWDSETSPIYHRPDGSPVQVGDTVVIADLATCLEEIAHEGARALYRGDIASSLVRASRQNGGLITTHDLEEARAADHVILTAGRVVGSGKPSDVLTTENLTNAYGLGSLHEHTATDLILPTEHHLNDHPH